MFLIIIWGIGSFVVAEQENTTAKEYCDRVLSINSNISKINDDAYTKCCVGEKNYTAVEECFFRESVPGSQYLLHFDESKVIIHNYTPQKLCLSWDEHPWGKWNNVPDVIAPWTSEHLYFVTGYFSDFEGTVRYYYDSKETPSATYYLNIYINYAYFGSPEISIQSDDENNVFYSWAPDVDGQTRHVYFQSLSDDQTKYNIVISSDPQPWRLQNGGDPNNQRMEWEIATENVFREIKRENADFLIINGDMTECGRDGQLESIKKQLCLTKTATLWGLGNHDYFNNLNDCSTDFDWSRNACAGTCPSLIKDGHDVYKSMMKNFKYDYNSLAYAWNYGKIRYAQLNFYPLYEKIKDFRFVRRRGSPWRFVPGI